MVKVIETTKAPGAIGPYSQAKLYNGFLYSSGQVGLDPIAGKLAEGGIEGQTEQACKNVAAILEAAGLGMDSVIKTTCFLAEIADFAAFNKVYAEYFTSKPARSCFAVKDLPLGALCEIEVIAAAK